MSQSPSPDGGTDVDRTTSASARKSAASANQSGVGFNIRFRDLESPDVMEATEDIASKFISAHKDTTEEFNPVDIDNFDLEGNTPLHLAVKGDQSPTAVIEGSRGFYEVAETLLHFGANPNKPLIGPSGNSSALLEACVKADVRMISLLLKHKAQDMDLKALQAAVMSRHDGMIGTILKYKAHSNSDNKINKGHLLQKYFSGEGGSTETASLMHDSYDSSNVMFPGHPVVIDWCGLQLTSVAKSWLLEACCLHNATLPPSQKTWALYAITRLDVSKNNLDSLPEVVFQLPSLKLLNASENLMAALPEPCAGASGDSPPGDQSGADGNATWCCPWLEDVQLQKNKLKTVPGALFKLPSLQKLNLSHNELERLPFDMWSSPSLHEVNLSDNRLKDLPCAAEVSLASVSESDSGLEVLRPSESGSPLTIHIGSPSPSVKGSIPIHGGGSDPRNSSTVDTTASPSQSVRSSVSLDTTGHSSTAPAYRETDVTHHAFWRGRLEVRVNFLENEGSSERDQYSHITELNLAKNQFETVPVCLACLCPKLSKLDLSFNRLTQVGHMWFYPAQLKSLDLSHNNIWSHVSPEDEGGGATGRFCFRPTGRGRR